MAKKPFRSGFCAHGQTPHHAACKGEFANGSYVKRPTTLCSCDCHGPWHDRMVAAGYTEEGEVNKAQTSDDKEEAERE